ncbi:hypothetical protein [Nocardioides sp. 1609]|uniref:hypothetical protein n=1 Tax=Nocardioides sp. 1609 TaxID=2508327 RepID=UPI001070534E|nr:hypothetical protein [Nocardioides sp. 1609]
MPDHDLDARYLLQTSSEINAEATRTLVVDRRKDEVIYRVKCPVCREAVAAVEYPGGTYRAIAVDDPLGDRDTMITVASEDEVPDRFKAVVPMACGCGSMHPKSPEGTTGCGATWLVPR